MRYIIAVKREQRPQAPANWQEPLRSLPGLQIIAGDDAFRVHVEASDEAIAEARRIMGDLVHIEPIIPHRTLR